jgi:hypothetical protein
VAGLILTDNVYRTHVNFAAIFFHNCNRKWWSMLTIARAVSCFFVLRHVISTMGDAMGKFGPGN